MAEHHQDSERTVILEAPIVEVEVFRSSALVHREGELHPDDREGERSCELGGLPLGLLDDSVRVSLEGETGCRVVDTQVILDVQTPIESVAVEEIERYKDVRRELDRLHRQRQRLELEVEGQLKLIPLLPPEPKRPDQSRFFVEDPLQGWLALGELMQQTNEAKLQRVRELRKETRRLSDELKQAQDRLRQLSSAKVARLQVGKRLRLGLAGRLLFPCQVRLSYQVPGARWVPTYELRVGDAGQAELVMSALVAQVTGEDWGDVALSLSTADLRRRCDLPRLGARRIGPPRPPEQRRAWRQLPNDLPQLFADYDLERPQELKAPSHPGFGDESQHQIQRMIAEVLEVDLPGSDGQTSRFADEAPAGEEVDFAVDEITNETPESQLLVDLEQEQEEQEDQEPTHARARMPQPPPAPPAMAPAMDPPDEMMKSPRPSVAAHRQAAPLEEVPSRSEPSPLQTRSPGRTETSLVPSSELLAFQNLVLASGQEGVRGMLRPLKSHEHLPPHQQGPEVVAAIQREEKVQVGRLHQLRSQALPAGACEVAESTGHFAQRYETRLTQTLPADGAFHRLGVMRGEAPMELLFRTVPATDGAVYRVARLTNALPRPLLAGPLDVFWGSDFLVTTRLETTVPGATIEANLGVEPRIKTARNVRHSQHEEGLLSGRTVYETRVQIEVQNGLVTPSTIEVLERLPVTEERKVEIKKLLEQPEAEEYEQTDRRHPIRGGRRFRLALASGERGECLLGYRVSLPSSTEIVGGGRRA